VQALGGDGIRVEVGDTGVGFLSNELPGERLGLRVSVIERVNAVGGVVDIDSHPGEGTIVTLEWPGVQVMPPSAEALSDRVLADDQGQLEGGRHGGKKDAS